MADIFKDFDSAVAEVEDRTAEFVIGGEQFEVNLNVPAGRVLKWMRNSGDTESIPELLVLFLGEDEFDRLADVDGIGWTQMTDLMSWLMEELAGSLGNG